MTERFLAPGLGDNSVEVPNLRLEARPRLESRLRRALTGRLTLLAAAPGYGKTVALARAAQLDSRPALWYRCASGDRCANLAREIALAVAPTDGSVEPAEAEGGPWETALSVALHSVRQPHLLLLDDVDRLPAAEAGRLTSFLAAELPPGWHALIASRRESPLPEVARLICQGLVDRLDEHDLAFDVDEAGAAADAWGVGHSDPDPACRDAQGWPLGVLAILRGRDHLLADYFQGSVLAALPPRIGRFLKATAVLDRLTPEACRDVTGFRNATHLLDEVTASHLFVLRHPHGLSYHPQFRAALLDMADRTGSIQLARCYERAIEHHLSRGDVQAAVDTAGATGNWSRVAEIVRSAAPGLIADARGADMAAWTANLSPEVLAQEPWLLHYRGVGLRLAGDDAYAALWRMQEQARDAFAAEGNREGRARALAELGTLACLRRQPAQARLLLEEARAELADSDLTLYGSVLSSLAEAYLALSQLSDAVRAGEEALALGGSNAASSVISVRAQALLHLALVRVREGHPTQAIEVASRALDLARHHQLHPHTRVFSTYVFGFAHLNKGEFERGLELLTQAATLAQEHGLDHLLLRISSTRAAALTALYRLDEADVLFQKANNSVAYLGDIGYLRIFQDRLVEARLIFQQQLDESLRGASEADVARAKTALGVIALRTKRPAEAERWLLEAATSFERTGARFRLAGTRLHLAHLYFLTKEPQRAKRLLQAALDFAVQEQCYAFFFWHPETFARLAVEALRLGIHPEWVELLCMRGLRSRDLRELLPLMSDRNPAVREPAVRIVEVILDREGMSAGLGELRDCGDDPARERLFKALVEGRLTARGLLLLRHQFGLTWAETDVFVEYYLTGVDVAAEGLEPQRRAVARQLILSENTLMHHVTSIRRKLGFGPRKGSAAVLLWALVAGITRMSSPSHPWTPPDNARTQLEVTASE
ncbi:MAG: hypothetical protein HY331_06750 [Chloroflexi bacterium]|nr:hypothetical protein [Chloroflexota bacterium]